MGLDHKQALQLARDGHWERAHEMVQPYSDKMACLIHAYLHREEGDLSNAGYWYRRAGEKMPDNTLEAELKRLAALLNAE
ncbi:hypothetical protein Q9L42_014040 [Methylomarinum sp. Ch1-1]|uniref:Sel1 repeat family protein n=1 Tax=Methylomarinum roseum TaxID=3067653 RepID=A0AAU7NR99_9GAMM|nr:hypothetical protein [Methylomarinum sp. Ch1-1]MDP4520553.1 hypothetical protein [Methylomarinum sp. Ch1-1]